MPAGRPALSGLTVPSALPRITPPPLRLTACTSTPLEEPLPPPADSEDAIPGTPPAKRAKFTFQRCFNQTMDPLRVPGHERVLAPDSDEDCAGLLPAGAERQAKTQL